MVQIDTILRVVLVIVYLAVLLLLMVSVFFPRKNPVGRELRALILKFVMIQNMG